MGFSVHSFHFANVVLTGCFDSSWPQSGELTSSNMHTPEMKVKRCISLVLSKHTCLEIFPADNCKFKYPET